ncbi:MAG: type III pantothenate kinase [Planctomycetota bacterium]
MSKALLVDAGNTLVKYAAVGSVEDGVVSVPLVNFAAAELPEAENYLVCSVVPFALEVLRKRYGAKVLALGEELRLPIQDTTKTPATTGVDRLAACYAAYSECGRDCLVVACGTALVSSIVRDGAFVGGNILPGPDLMSKALSVGTAALPAKSRDPFADDLIIGDSTETAVSRGIRLSLVSAINMMIVHCLDRLNDPAVFLTGGWAAKVLPVLPPEVRHRPNLVLKGLELVAAHL